MPMQTLSVKLLSCKILKTKNSVSFEVQYYSRLLHSINSLLKILTLYQVPWMTKTGRTSRVFRRPTRKNARRHTTTTSTPWSGDGDNKKKLYSFVKKNKYDSSSVASLKKDGNTVGEARGKAEVLNSQFSSVFTEEGDSPIPNLGTRSTPDAPNIQVGRNCVMKLLRGLKVSKVAKIRNRYNQVPHLTQDTNGKVTNSQKTPQTRAKRSALSQQVTTKHI